MRQNILYIFLLSILISQSCKKDPEVNIDDEEKLEIEAYLDSLGLLSSTTQDTSGLYYYPITLNPGGKSQSEGKVLSFFYSMTLLDGTVVDQYDSLDSDTLVVKQGAGAIYPVGFDYSLAHLKEGEKYGFILPSRLAFGQYSFGSLIPENAIIRLEIELLEIRSEEDVLDEEYDLITQYLTANDLQDTVEYLSNGMVYHLLYAGGGAAPTVDSIVSVAYTGSFLDNSVFDQVSSGDPFQFFYGKDQVIPGLEIGIGRMVVGDRAMIIVPSYLGYKESAQVLPPYLTNDMISELIVPAYAAKIGPYKPLIFEIQLIDVN